ncbi:hypothetical protein DTO271G3_930 [Paecilomyces variotii]|nr:hypothetical protein DTO271G3_930 [Paecilomyces variotii]
MGRYVCQGIEIIAIPHTTPIKTANTTIHAYRSYLNQGQQFGDTGVFATVEGEDLRHYRAIEKGPYGEILTELEEDEEQK